MGQRLFSEQMSGPWLLATRSVRAVGGGWRMEKRTRLSLTAPLSPQQPAKAVTLIISRLLSLQLDSLINHLLYLPLLLLGHKSRRCQTVCLGMFASRPLMDGLNK